MNGQNVLYGDINELIAIRDELKAYEDVKKKVNDYTLVTQRLKKDIVSEEKLLADTIDSTVKKRREQVVANFDKELKKAQDRLKKLRESRGKAKTKGVEERIRLETAEYVQENKNLKEEVKTHLRQKGIPSIFNSNFLYSLFFPKTIYDLVVLAVIALVFVIAIPLIVINLLKVHVVFKVLIFILLAAIVPVIYGFGYKYARIEHRTDFIEKREQRYRIRKNNKQIRRIKRSIKKDSDEEFYNLSDFDEQIEDMEDTINDIVQKKNVVLNKFETVTKPEITEEITERETPRIEGVRAKLNEAQLQLKSYNDMQQNMSMKIASNYAAYMGNENMTITKIDKLIAIMQDGRARTIGDAVNIAKVMQ